MSRRGQSQVPSDIRNQVALELSKIIIKATKDEDTLAPSWAERFSDTMFEAEEIEAHFSVAYPNEGTPGAYPSGRGYPTFRVIRTPSLSEMSRISHMGFDPHFLRLDPRRVIENILEDLGVRSQEFSIQEDSRKERT